MAGNVKPAGQTVASRVFALLSAFDERHTELRLTELARRADLAPATAHRLLAELTKWGALERRADGGYVIGKRLWRLGMLATTPGGLREAASPFLHDVYAATLATVHLAVRDGLESLYVARLAGHRSVPILSSEGTRTPLHATAVGKVLLAHAPAAVRAQAMEHLVRMTPHTITSPGTLTRQLERIRDSGFAQSNEEMSLGTNAVAVPVFRGAEPIAALGAAIASARRDRGRLVTALQIAARGISRNLEHDFRWAERD